MSKTTNTPSPCRNCTYLPCRCDPLAKEYSSPFEGLLATYPERADEHHNRRTVKRMLDVYPVRDERDSWLLLAAERYRAWVEDKRDCDPDFNRVWKLDNFIANYRWYDWLPDDLRARVRAEALGVIQRS